MRGLQPPMGGECGRAEAGHPFAFARNDEHRHATCRIACIGNVEAKKRRGRARKCATSGSLSWGFRQWYKLWLNVRVRKLFHIERQPCPIEQQRAAAYRPVALRRTVVSGRRVLYLPVELRARELMATGFLRRARLERGNGVGN